MQEDLVHEPSGVCLTVSPFQDFTPWLYTGKDVMLQIWSELQKVSETVTTFTNNNPKQLLTF